MVNSYLDFPLKKKYNMVIVLLHFYCVLTYYPVVSTNNKSVVSEQNGSEKHKVPRTHFLDYTVWCLLL